MVARAGARGEGTSVVCWTWASPAAGAARYSGDVADDSRWTYDAVRHPELDADGGRTIFVSHSRPKGTGWFDAELPLWRVELAAE